MKYITIILAALIITVFTTKTESQTPPPEESSPRVENGGFERPDIGSYEFFSERIPGWTVTQESIEIIDASYGNGFRVRSGSQLVDLSGRGTIYQDIPTNPDSTYRLVFHLYKEPDAPAPSTLTVEAGDVREEYEISPEQSEYRREALQFEGAADAGETRITFTSTIGDTEYGPIIDDVSVEVIDS